jgi:hypothetical protein
MSAVAVTLATNVVDLDARAHRYWVGHIAHERGNVRRQLWASERAAERGSALVGDDWYFAVRVVHDVLDGRERRRELVGNVLVWGSGRVERIERADLSVSLAEVSAAASW